jgi:hypothetical protein
MSRDEGTRGDEELGAALRELETPEHGPDFYVALHHRLADDRVGGIADARPRQKARHARTRWTVRVAFVAAVAAVVFVAIGIPRTERTPRIAGPEVATAAEIKAKVRAALATAKNLSGLLVVDGPDKGDEARFSYVLTDRGDFRLLARDRASDRAYDATTGVERFYSTLEDGTKFAVESTGLAPGPPDPHASDWALPRDFGAVVRAFLSAKDPRVKEVTYEGRAAWQLDMAVAPNLIVVELGVSADHLSITVDQRTGIPVKIVETFQGRFLSESRIEKLAVDRDLPPGTFTLDFPARWKVEHHDFGFQRLPLARVESIVGYAPLVPAWVPEGYELAEVAAAKEPGSPTGVEAANPHSEGVVSLSYRRGLDQFLVTTRLSRVVAPGEPRLPLDELWSDPLATGEGFVDEPERITLSGGALAGIDADLLIVPRNVPHVWALTNELVVTVSGDLNRAQLLRVTESLRQAK